MDSNKKKVQISEPLKVETKKRESQSKELQSEESKNTRNENSYIKLALNAKSEERAEISTRVKNGELKFAYYALENDKPYHFYLKLKK